MVKITCAECDKTFLVDVAERNCTFTSVAVPAYEKGWRMARGSWFCSRECIVEAAREVPHNK